MNETTLTSFLEEHWKALLLRCAEHLAMAGVSTTAALVVGVILSVLSYRSAYLRGWLLTFVSILQTVPGIALLVTIMAIFHQIGFLPAIVTLFLFALLPIIQNTLVALCSLPSALAEVTRGLGMTNWQRLRYVRLPLALPNVVAGLRIAAVQTVGLATLAAFIGAGGLGQFINRGLFLSDTKLILLGAIPAALIALIIDQLISLLEMSITPQCSPATRRACGVSSAIIAALLIIFTLYYTYSDAKNDQKTVVIGSKNFTEQLIIAEVVAQQIEAHTDLTVQRRFGLGGSNVLHTTLTQATIDIAVEYSGTALVSILHKEIPADRSQVISQLRQEYEKLFGLTWLDPLGFNNTYCLAVRSDDARLANVTTLSQLAQIAPQLEAAFDFEFAERQDGYAGLKQAYNLNFKQVRDMHPDLMYNALSGNQVDIISAYSTDGRLGRDKAKIMIDDKAFFPPYEAAIIVSPTLLKAHPDLAAALGALSGKLSDDRMRSLNALVDTKQMSVEQAASLALTELSLVQAK